MTPAARVALPCPPGEADAFISTPPPAVAAALRRHPGPCVVLGAGGKLGLHFTWMLRRALQEAGSTDPVLAVSRFQTLRSREDFDRYGLPAVACDLEDPAALARLPDAANVFFLAGVKFGTANDPELLHRLNVRMPGLVADRYRKARIVAFSTGGVYPFMSVASGGANETTPVAPVGAYSISCVDRERAFARGAAQHGTPVTLLRLNYAVEFRYGVLVDIAGRVLRGEPVDLTMGHLNLIWQTDAIAQSIQALAVAGVPAVPINVTGPQILSVRDLAQRFGTLFGREPRFVGTDAGTATLSDASWARKRFGEPTVPLDDMIAWTAAWLQQGLLTWGKPTGFEKRNGQY